GVAMASAIAVSNEDASLTAPQSQLNAVASLDRPTHRSSAEPGAADAPISFDLNLQGEIAGLAAGAPATATVVVGGRSYPATVQGNAYTASFTALSEDEMVVVEVVSTRARYRSVLGSAARLALAAGNDSTVTVAERSSLRVSPVSSALAWMVRVGLDGRDAVSDAEFEKTTRSIVGWHLATAAYTLNAWTAGTMALPQGFQDGQQVLESSAVYAQAAQVNSTLAMAYLFDQADSAPLASVEQLPDGLAMLGPVPLNEPAMTVSDLQVLYRQLDGSYALFEEEPLTAHPRYAATLTAPGGVALAPLGDAGTRNILRYLPFRPSEQLPVHRVSRGHELRRLVVGEVYDLWVSRSVWFDSHHSAAGDYEQENTEYSTWSAFDLKAVSTANPWGPVLGTELYGPTYWLPAACSTSRRAAHLPAFGKCAVLEHSFRLNYGGFGSGHAYNTETVDDRMGMVYASGARNFSYQTEIDAGLRVSFASSSDPAGTSTTFWRYEAGTPLLRPVIYLARIPGASFVGASVAMAAQYDVTPLYQGGSWRGPNSLAKLAAYPAPISYLEIRRNIDYSGRDVTVYPNGESAIPGTWTPVNTGVADYQYRASFANSPLPRNVANCQSAFATGATGCAPSRVRYFRPVQRIGARMYGVVDFYSNALLPPASHTGPYEVQVLDSRADYAECVAGPCLPTATP
ncbi:MAG: hypothetical protein ACREP7_21680, partial [Lysobacter sp.]